MKDWFAQLIWPALTGVLAAIVILNADNLFDSGSSSEPRSYNDAVVKATPSVVNIYTAKLVADRQPTLNSPLLRRFLSEQRRPRVERSLGSGVIMSELGHIITNNHVIAGADAIQVLLSDGRSASAIVLGSDPETDLAVLKIDLPNLMPIEPADSDVIDVGDVVLAIGNPYGFGHSVSLGIISGLERYGLQLSAFENYIQTDASIHLGNSGGALIDNTGRLVGINTLIYSGGNNDDTDIDNVVGINLATPSNLVLVVMNDLIEYGRVIRGWLGVSAEMIIGIDDLGQTTRSLLVTDTAPYGPATRAGIEPGDLIIALDGEPVDDVRRAMQTIARLRPGERVQVGLQRAEQQLSVDAVVASRPEIN